MTNDKINWQPPKGDTPEIPKKEIKLPEAVWKLLEKQNIEKEDVTEASLADMNVHGEYAVGYVVLTKGQLIVFKGQPDNTAPHNFKGFVKKDDISEIKNQELSVSVFNNNDIKEVLIEPMVASSLLLIETREHGAVSLLAFSNLYRRSMGNIKRELERIIAENTKAEEGEVGEDQNRPGRAEGFGGKGPGGRGGFGGPGGRGGRGEGDEFCPKCGMMYPDRNRKVCPRCMDKRSIFFRMLGYFRPYLPQIIVLLIIYFAVAGLSLVWPYLNGTVLYDYVLKQNPEFLAKIGLESGQYVTALLWVILTMFAARFVSHILHTIQGILTARIVANVVRDIKKSIFDSMGKLSISFFKNRQTGSLMTRVLGDAERVTGFFIDGLPYIFIHGFTIIASFVMMFSINWKMALAALICLPVAFIFTFYMRPKIWTAFGHRHRAERSVNTQVNDNLTGARVVKAFGQEANEEQRFSGSNERLKNAELSIVRVQNWYSLVFNFTQSFATIVIWFLGVYFIVEKGSIQLGILITFIGYADQLNGPLNFISRVFRWWADSMNSAERMFEIIDAVPEIQEIEEPKHLDTAKGHVVLNDVTFGYEVNRPVLKHINLDIPAGSMLGIVGRSGAGKTTLVNLISRLYDPQEGFITIDDVDIRDMEFASLRRNVAMVSQETYIFMGTVEENIAYANPKATKSEIIRAAKLASAHDFILRMPDGYNTMIGSSGRELSGGERQRISIARAILADPKILILDEATASVDTETERAIQESLEYLVKGRTTISIAHRLSTLRDADFLVVVDNGEITERGTHQELFDMHGTYYKLMELQTKALQLKEEM